MNKENKMLRVLAVLMLIMAVFNIFYAYFSNQPIFYIFTVTDCILAGLDYWASTESK